MENILNIYVNEDDSVQKKLDKRAVKLQRKYYKRRKFNEKYVKYKSGFQKFLSKLGFFFGIVLVVVSVFLCFCNLMARMNNLVPSVGGYSTLKVETTSMTASGIKQFDTIVARSCDERTIGEGDIIVFYVYWPSSYKFINLNCKRVDDSDIPELRYSVTKEEFIGIQNQEKKLAAKANAKRVIHQVIEVYEDYKGERWFKTKGTSNLTEDSWWINEKFVIGAYDNSGVAATMSVVVNDNDFLPVKETLIADIQRNRFKFQHRCGMKSHRKFAETVVINDITPLLSRFVNIFTLNTSGIDDPGAFA